MNRKIILTSFTLSGLAGLIYQLVWVKMLALVFGDTISAVALVVAAFLAGLALGSHLLGRWVDRFKSPIRVYIGLEIMIAASALLISRGLGGLDQLLAGFFVPAAINSAGATACRFIFPFIMLLIPTFLMGGTTPVISKVYINRINRLGGKISALYAANTYGAMFGAVFCAFLFIPALGLAATVRVAALLNLLVAVLMGLGGLVQSQKTDPAPPLQTTENTEASNLIQPGKIKIALLLICLSGFISLAYEILWTRGFVVSMNATVYLFAGLLSLFLLGMAAGSQLISHYLDRLKSPLVLFGFLQLFIGFSGLLSIYYFDYLNNSPLNLGVLTNNTSWFKAALGDLGVMALLLVIPTFLMGICYPLICKTVATSMTSLGRDVGTVYAIGTAGGIAGSLLAAFFFLPALGLQNSLLVTAFLAMTTGLLGLSQATNRKILQRALPAILLVMAVSAWGIGSSSMDIGLGKSSAGRTVFAREGLQGTVKVIEDPQNHRLNLMVNNYRLASSGDVAVRFGNIPLILKPEAEDVLLISLGSGIAAGAIGNHPVKNIECVEIVPSLYEVQGLFSEHNHDIIHDPRFKLTFWDGRHYVLTSPRRYDLVIADLFQPDSAGVGNLYALEHFENVRAKLKKSGAMAQWLPMYQLSPENLKVVMRTFAAVFPNVSVWYGDMIGRMPALLLLGSEGPLKINPGKLIESLARPGVAQDMIEHDDPFSFLSFYITDRQGLLEYTGAAAINSDDRPIIEYTAPRHYFAREQNALKNFASFIELRKDFVPLLPAGQDENIVKIMANYYKARSLILRGRVFLAEEQINMSWTYLSEAAKLAPHDPFLGLSAFELGYFLVGKEAYDSAKPVLEFSREVNPDLEDTHYFLAKTYEKLAMPQEAAAALKEFNILREKRLNGAGKKP